MKTGIDSFDLFWETYPSRRGSKVTKSDCIKWWKKNKPSDELVAQMIEWLKADMAARVKAKAMNGFYAAPKDPIRWLRGEGWMDDVPCRLCYKPAEKDGLCEEHYRRQRAQADTKKPAEMQFSENRQKAINSLVSGLSNKLAGKR